MAHNLKTIHVSEYSDITQLLEEADVHPVRLEKGGIGYHLSREDAVAPVAYDPAIVRDAVRAASGMLTLEEGKALKSYIYDAREEGSRPPTRP